MDAVINTIATTAHEYVGCPLVNPSTYKNEIIMQRTGLIPFFIPSNIKYSIGYTNDGIIAKVAKPVFVKKIKLQLHTTNNAWALDKPKYSLIRICPQKSIQKKCAAKKRI